jgi:acetyl esterase/lipase
MVLDPSLFRPESIDVETAEFNRQIEAMMALAPPIQTQQAHDVRAAVRERGSWRGPVVYSDNAIVRQIAGPAGDLSLRSFIPKQVNGVYLHIHAGGWTLGTSDGQDERLEALSNDCNVAVISVEYRLAPEDPYPAGPDDCEAAALWLVKHARSEFGTEDLVIGGESAGANLAVVTLLRLRDKHGITPFSAAYLSCGVYDAAGTPSVLNWGERNLILSRPAMKWFADQYVKPELLRDPDVSPLYANLSDLPPALFTVGTMDPLLDDSLFMHSRWVAAGNSGDIAVIPGGVHMIDTLPIERGRRAFQRAEAFIRDAIALRPTA